MLKLTVDRRRRRGRADRGLPRRAQAAEPYTFALVPKNTNNPFFDQALAGCKKAEKELKGAIKCLYIGPGEHGGGDEQAQIVADLITKKVDGIAVSAANAPAIANALKDAAEEQDPGAHLGLGPSAAGQGACAPPMSARTITTSASTSPSSSWQIKPKGGTICIQSGGAAAANHNERMQGIRDTLAGKKSAESPGERLTGQNGWTEVAGCPLYTNDDFPLAVQQMEDILAKYPKLDAFTPTGGFPQFVPDAYEKVDEQVQGQDRRRQARARRRRHAAGADRPDEEGSLRPARSASGRSRWATRRCTSSRTSRTARPRRPTRPIPASTSARRRTSTPASAAEADVPRDDGEMERGRPRAGPFYFARAVPRPRRAKPEMRPRCGLVQIAGL